MKPRVLKVITGVNMGCEHQGLYKLLKKELGIDLYKIKSDELVLCVNRARTAAKMIGCGGSVIGYLRFPGNGFLKGVESLKHISQTFGGSGFQFGEQIQGVLRDLFEGPN